MRSFTKSLTSRLPRAADCHIDIDTYINKLIPHFPRHHLPQPLLHLAGHRHKSSPDVGNVLIAFWGCIGAFAGLVVVSAVLKYVTWIQALDPPVIIGSLGAAAVLSFNAISSPLGQPRNVVLGNVISAFIGVCVAKAFGLDKEAALGGNVQQSTRWLAGPLACGLASAAMTLTNTVHPPGGSTALLAVTDATMNGLGWWLVLLMLIATLLLVGVSLVMNNIQRRYPVWWWTPLETGQIWRRSPKTSSGGTSDEEKTVGDSEADIVSRDVASIQEERAMGRAPDDSILLTIDGLMNIPDHVHLTHEEQTVLDGLLQKLERGTYASAHHGRRSQSHTRSKSRSRDKLDPFGDDMKRKSSSTLPP